jgi:hypothetical protein
MAERWFLEPAPLQPLPSFLDARRRELPPPAARLPPPPRVVAPSAPAPPANKRPRRGSSAAAAAGAIPELPDPARCYGAAWAGRCRILEQGQLYAVPYHLSDLAADMDDDGDELLVVELSWGGGPGWLEDRGVAFVLKERQAGGAPLRVLAEEVRRLVQQRVDLNRAPARTLRRAIYGLHRPVPGLAVTLLPMADLTAEAASAVAAAVTAAEAAAPAGAGA